MTTTEKMKFLMQKSDASLNIVLPKNLKKKAFQASKKEGLNISQFTKLALLEKLERDQMAIPE